MFTRPLVKVGNNYAVVLDRTLMDLAGIPPVVPVNLHVLGRTLSISPSQAPIPVDQAIDQVSDRHKEILRRLAK